MKCEVCGSNDLTKRDDLFVCDFCGAKYSLEAVRKMVMEGKVEVSGSISVNQTPKIKGLLQSALDDYEDSNYDSALAAVNEALLIDPYIPDALFLKSLLSDRKDTYQVQKFYDRAMENLDKSVGIFTKEDYDYDLSLVTVFFRNYMANTSVRIFFNQEQIYDGLAPNHRISIRFPRGQTTVTIFDTSGNRLASSDVMFKEGLYINLQQKGLSNAVIKAL